MKKTIKFLAVGFVVAAAAFGVQSCSDDDSVDPNAGLPKYIIYGNNDNSSYLLGTESLTEGTVSIIGNGADITKYEGIRAPNLIQKGGFFYWVDSDGGKFVKLKYESEQLVIVKEIPFTTPTSAVGAYHWIDDNTIFVGFWQHYATINVEEMKILSGAPFPITDLGFGFEADAFIVKNGKLYLPYVYFNEAGYTDGVSRLAVMDFPAMTNVTYTEDARFDYPAGTNGSQPVMFEENGYIYVTCTSIFGNPDLGDHSGILRIKVGENVYDPNFQIDLNTGVAEEASVGLYYLGNGKAIVKTTPSGFYVIDVNAKTKTKINVPASGVSFRGNVLVEDGKAYILTDSDYYVYTYDPANSNVTKGLKVEGINFIQSLYKIH